MKPYGIEYSWADGMYIIEVPADSAEEAMERIRVAASRGRCFTPHGIELTIPDYLGGGLIARLYVWLRNLFKAKE